MEIDKTRYDETAATVDLGCLRLRWHGSDRSDRVAGKGEIHVAAVDMARRRLVPRDDPRGPSDDGLRLRHDEPSIGPATLNARE
jgi:hypothetical protein